MTYGTLNAVVPLVFFLVLTSMAMMLPWLTLAGLGKGNSQGNVETMDLVGDDAEKDGIEWEVNYNGWWFQTFAIFHIILDNPSH